MINNSAVIRTRIAPSPTGKLHIGTARTALFNYLFAKKIGGKFIVRIEDTDLERSEKKFEKNVLEGLEWLGIEQDEGPMAGGLHGPYRQSERTGIYKPYLEKLLAESKAFYCFHSEKELEEEKDNLMKNKKPAVHLCEYRNISLEEANILKDAKREDYVIRFKNHIGHKIVFNDLIRGEVVFDSDLIGDFSLAKNLDTVLYNFAVVIDDETMEISHVIRGEDHISNTPKQLLLIEALGFKKPQYAHLPLILGPDRSKMSKRHGAISVDEYRELGYLSEALFNFMALLGWNPGDDREILSKEKLIELFSLDKVQKSGAIFDINKLDWMNGTYIRQKSVSELTKLCLPFIERAGLLQAQSAKRKAPALPADRQNRNSKLKTDYIEKIIALEQPRLKKLSELPERADYFFREPEYDKELLRWKNITDAEIVESIKKLVELLKENLESDIKNIEKVFLEEAKKAWDRGNLLWPLRAALSGKKASAGPFEIVSVLGVDESLKRLETALKKYGK